MSAQQTAAMAFRASRFAKGLTLSSINIIFTSVDVLRIGLSLFLKMKNMNRRCFFLTILFVLMWAQAGADHTLAVLPFEDRSGFDGHWDLSRGISHLLAERLNQVQGYRMTMVDSSAELSVGEILECGHEFTADSLYSPYDSLGVGYLICGTVEDFGISRFGIATPGVGGYQAYRAKVRVRFSVYQRGASIPVLEDESEGEIKQRGLGLTFLGKPTEQMEEYELLDRLEFGSPQFMSTIAGKAVEALLMEMVEKIQLTLPPQEDLDSDIGLAVILSIEEGQVYMNRGYEDEVKVGDEFEVYTRGEELRDPETNELLGYTDRKVGRIQVTFVKSAHLSRARVVEGEGEIAPGDEVRTE